MRAETYCSISVAVPQEVLFDDKNIFTNTSSSPGVKMKRQCRSLAVKYQALLDLETGGKSKGEVCRDYNITHSTLSTWVKIAGNIKNAFYENEQARHRKRLRRSNYADVEEAVLQWCHKVQSDQKKLTTACIARKASQVAEYLGYTPQAFRGSNGWAERFRQRHGFGKKKDPLD